MIDEINIRPNESTGKIEIYIKGEKKGEANGWAEAGELADKLRFADEIVLSER